MSAKLYLKSTSRVAVFANSSEQQNELLASVSKNGLTPKPYQCGEDLLETLADVDVVLFLDDFSAPSWQQNLPLIKVRAKELLLIAVVPAWDVAAAVRALRCGVDAVMTWPLSAQGLRHKLIELGVLAK